MTRKGPFRRGEVDRRSFVTFLDDMKEVCHISSHMYSHTQQYPSADPEQEGMSSTQSNLLELQDQLLGQHFDRNHQDTGASAKLVDSLLAKEFNKLSVHERSKTYEELHGVDETVEEKPVFVEKALQQLDEEVAKIRRKSAYELAEQQNKEYVTNPKFRIMFLRASGFDAKKAAHWLVDYFEGMLKYFGESLLTKRIQYSDLDRDDQACVKDGCSQMLPARDRSGRVVLVGIGMSQDQSYATPTNRLKASIYIWLMLAEDEENQKRGLVLILFQMGSMDVSSASRTLARELPRVLNWLPLRVCALHYCTDNDFVAFSFRAAVVGGPADVRARHRCHNGTFTEIMYSLLGYGIPVDLIPTNDGVAIKKSNLSRWITKNVARDKELSNGGTFSGTDLPTRHDVLMGKGKPFQHHPGNAHLRILVDAMQDQYSAARQSRDKVNVVYRVCSMIKARSGRFLERDDDGWWRESNDIDAVDKVTTLFRRTSKKEKPKRRNHALSKPDEVGDYASMFLLHGKRPRYVASCCGP